MRKKYISIHFNTFAYNFYWTIVTKVLPDLYNMKNTSLQIYQESSYFFFLFPCIPPPLQKTTFDFKKVQSFNSFTFFYSIVVFYSFVPIFYKKNYGNLPFSLLSLVLQLAISKSSSSKSLQITQGRFEIHCLYVWDFVKA